MMATGTNFLIWLIGACLALFASSSEADEQARQLSCVYSSHGAITSDNKMNAHFTFGIWRVGHAVVVNAPGTSAQISIPVVTDNSDYLIASTLPTGDGSFELVVLDKKQNTLKETRVGAAGKVLTDHTGQCHDMRTDKPPPAP